MGDLLLVLLGGVLGYGYAKFGVSGTFVWVRERFLSLFSSLRGSQSEDDKKGN